MKTLEIDIETYSDVDLAKCGVYRYCESPLFEIMLFGYSIDEAPVHVVDLCTGESIPEEVLSALTDDSVTKWAHNAAFERVCLSRWLRKNHPEHFVSYSIPEDTVGNYLDPASWRCSMVWSAYMGLPLSLKDVGAILKLDEQKLSEGKDLVRYFCTPCKPTIANGGRTRNRPADDMAKWALFRKYNARDVEVEQAIRHRLQKYPVPDFVWDEYHLSEEINDRGIAIDSMVVDHAIEMDARSREELMDAMRELTNLENPNSAAQLKEWLGKCGLETHTLGKKTVAALIKEAPPELQKVLALRLQISKSSVKKYTAMHDCVCADGRARGMFFFYGAARSGRWAGRHIQLQNLPQDHLPDLEYARDLVRNGDYDAVRMLYDDVPDTLSQLVRTAFIPSAGRKFIVSDFSAIEARVLAYLAGEQWRLDLFDAGGDIYCQSASRMFKVPVEKHGINSDLRQKGKIAELACIAEGQPVLTNHGEKPIEEVTIDDLLWDGESWVHHDGVVFKGTREVITYEGLTATSDHLVWVEGESEPVQFGIAATSGAHLVQTGNGGQPVRLGNHYQPGKEMEQDPESLLCANPMQGLRVSAVADYGRSDFREIPGLSGLLSAEADPEMVTEAPFRGQESLREFEGSRVPALWRQRNSVPIPQRAVGGTVSDKYIRYAGSINGTGSHRQQRALRAGQHPICHQGGESGQSANHGTGRIRSTVLAVQPQCSRSQTISRADAFGDHNGRGDISVRETEELACHQRKARLYDIRNAGPHHRFTVSGHLVHNCGYGGGVGALKAMGALDMGLTEEELQPLVDAWRTSNPHIVAFWWAVDRAAKTAIRMHTETETHGLRFIYKSGMLFVELPSGRRLSYVKPRIGTNKFGGESITYEGAGNMKRWCRIESYGPKLVENITQAISRDILAFAMKTLSHSFIVAHVHDELIIECTPEVSLDAICEQMGRTPPWLPGIKLRADGYETMFYKKD